MSPSPASKLSRAFQSMPMGDRRGSRWPTLVKAGVTIAILALVASRADWSGMGERMLAADPVWLLAGIAAKAMSAVFAAERWRETLAAAGSRISHWLGLRVMLVGAFFGQVLPGVVGGDVVRGWLTYRADCPAGAVVLAFVLDRVLAMGACILLLFAGLPHLADSATPALLAAAALIFLGMAVAMVGVMFADHLLVRLPGGLSARLPGLAQAQARLPWLRRALIGRHAGIGLGHAVAVHLCTIAAATAFAHALALPITVLDMVAVVPATIFAAALPISINGWGAREGAFVAGMALYGIGAAEAMMVSLMIGVSITLFSLAGGLVWLMTPAQAPEHQA